MTRVLENIVDTQLSMIASGAAPRQMYCTAKVIAPKYLHPSSLHDPMDDPLLCLLGEDATITLPAQPLSMLLGF